jgi:hypothetical protein
MIMETSLIFFYGNEVQISSINLTEKRPDIAINVGTFSIIFDIPRFKIFGAIENRIKTDFHNMGSS